MASRNAPGPDASIRVQMTGSEWFAARPGGLNRYFENLYLALRVHEGVEVSASAFGPPVRGGHSWGDLGAHLVQRVLVSRRGERPAAGTVLDRHFVLYGPRKSGAALVVHFQGPWAAESRMAGAGWVSTSVKRCVERLRIRPSDRVVVLCQRFADIVVQQYGVPADRVRVIPPGVDLGKFALDPVLPDQAAVVCVRRLERRMGIDVLLRSWKLVQQRRPGARLIIVGRGTQERALRDLATELGLDSSVRFETNADDAAVLQLYREATVTVIPTVALEGFGLIALESLAVGRAPVVTDCGGLPDAVRGLDPSLVVPPGDVQALADRLSRGLDGEHPGPQQCRDHAERFSWAAVAAAHVDLYRGLV